MKKTAILTIIILLISISGLFGISNTYAADSSNSPAIVAEAAILIDQVTGKILYQKNADRLMYPASTTKILTALVAVEHGDLDEILTVGSEVLHIAWDSSKAGFMIGDQITLRELIFGLMLPSGNDAAYIIAVHFGRQQAKDPELSVNKALEVFAEMMNHRARQVGANATNFTVPDGYHHQNHYTTAQNLALLAREAMEHDFLREVVGTSRYVPETWIGPHARAWGNTNMLIRPSEKFFYEHATGFKTGYTGPAGFCVVSSGNLDDMELIAVVLNTSRDGRWHDSTDLLNYGFHNFAWKQLVTENEIIQTVNINKQDHNQPDSISLAAVHSFGGIFALEELPNIMRLVTLNDDFIDKQAKTSGVQAAGDSEPTLMAPIQKGDIVGQIIFTLDDQELFRTDLVSNEDISAMPWWRKVMVPGIFSIGLGLPCVLIINIRKKRRHKIFKRKIFGR